MAEVLFAAIVFVNLYMVSIAESGDRLGMAVFLMLVYLAMFLLERTAGGRREGAR
jgi:hypothetical protein